MLSMSYLMYSDPRCRKSRLAWSVIALSIVLSAGTLVLVIASPWFLTFGTEEEPEVLANNDAGLSHLWLPGTDKDTMLRASEVNRVLTTAADMHYSTCYASAYSTDCRSNLVASSLPFHIYHDVDCPFQSNICVDSSDNDAAKPIRITTEWLNMSELGLNTKEDVQIQKSTICAPIRARSFCTNCESDDDYLDFQYGDPDYYFSRFYLNSTGVGGYRLVATEWAPATNLSFDSRLATQDGSVTMIFFSPIGIFADQPSNDPLFGTNKTVIINAVKWWLPHYLVTSLACIDQMRVSNNRTGVVSPWQGPESAFQDLSVYDNAESQKLAIILSWSSLGLSTYNITAGRGAAALRATRSLQDLSQTNIAPNQTQEEILAWFGTSLAKLQLAILSVGIGDVRYNTTGWIDYKPLWQSMYGSTVDLSNLAGYVKFRDGSYSMLSVAGIASICAVGFVLCATAILLDFWAPLPTAPAATPAANKMQMMPLLPPPPQNISLAQPIASAGMSPTFLTPQQQHLLSPQLNNGMSPSTTRSSSYQRHAHSASTSWSHLMDSNTASPTTPYDPMLPQYSQSNAAYHQYSTHQV